MGDRSTIFTISPRSRFLPTLAEAIVSGAIFPDWPREGPFWLADMTIFLPTRRARSVLAGALAAALGDRPMLLPDIRALGGDDSTFEPFVPPYEPVSLPAPVSRLKRRLILARLVEKWLETRTDFPFSAPALGGHRGRPNGAEVLALADSLATLIDDFAIAGLEPDVLAHIAEDGLAARLQDNLGFVRFVLEAWPGILEESGEIDAARRNTALVGKQAQALGALYGDRPVIVAGSTGSMPATATLIGAIAGLTRGAVVLPGLDTTLDASTVAALRDPARNPHGHPQYGLVALLDKLGTTPGSVVTLGPGPSRRVAALNAALALADQTAGWHAAAAEMGPDLDEASADLSMIVARTEDEEARAVAIAARAGLERGLSVAIIAPDQTLARRIGAELARFAIAIDDAAGTPLALSRAGRLVRQIVTLLANGTAPVDLMALLRNRHVGLGLGRAAIAQAGEALDLMVLRGHRMRGGIAGLRAEVLARAQATEGRGARMLPAEASAIELVLDALETATAPMKALLARPSFHAGAFANALAQTLAGVRAGEAGGAPDPLDGEVELERWMETLSRLEGLGPLLDRTSLPVALGGLMAGQSVRPQRNGTPALAIFGRLEARLIDADCTILAGLTEGAWPEIADPGPWLSRGMRMTAGLEPPEKQHGLAAHDFLMAVGRGEVVMSRSERAGTGPASPSRLVQRLEGFVGAKRTEAMRARGDHWIDLARRLDLTGAPPRPAARPAPRPDRSVRPRRLSITDAETLLRSPYDLYAKHTLRLRHIDPLGADPDLAERGTIIHGIFGDFIAQGHDVNGADALSRLLAIARERFSALESIPARRDLWLNRFARAAEAFLAHERARDARVAERRAEIEGAWTFTIDGESFVLHGRADRIDRMASGKFEIMDFKTGAIPADADMKGFLAPQLPLEAIMARNGGFAPVGRAASEALTYVKIAAGPNAFEPKPFALPEGMDTDIFAGETFLRFQRHVQALLARDDRPLAARVFPRTGQRYRGAYEHLARTEEWTLVDGEEGGEE